jgi:hypothetical protein
VWAATQLEPLMTFGGGTRLEVLRLGDLPGVPLWGASRGRQSVGSESAPSYAALDACSQFPVARTAQ